MQNFPQQSGDLTTFSIPVIYEMYGRLWVTADSLEEAREKVFDFATPLPENASYIEDSIQIDEEGLLMSYPQMTMVKDLK